MRRSKLTGIPSLDYDDYKEEKPGQKVPSVVLLLLLGAYLTLGYVTQLIEDDMPKPISGSEIKTDDASDTFSEESAKKYLTEILGYEPRVAGTAFHYEKTKDLKALLDNIAERAHLPVRTDWQFVSGDFWLAFDTPHVNCYRNLSNIIAVLEGESGFHPDGSIGTSLLVNCHYDSVPFAIGASDNGVFCAVMVETLSRLSRRKTKLKHNVIFLFNGAEENPLQGSHGFLQHPWSRGVTNVVNLDAAGMNGKPIVFQVSDPRVISAYQRAVGSPNAQGFGEILFRSGLIPSDTDFRIWRDFGDIHGIDIAFIKWGNVYHTRNDRPELIQDGVVQNAGNMLLNLVKELADSEDLKTKVTPTTAVYYDYLNLFLVTYGPAAAQAVDVSVALFALLTVAYYLWIVGFRVSSIEDLWYTVLGQLLAAAVGTWTVVILVLLMAAASTQLRYLQRPWLVVPFYWIPFFIASFVTALKYDKEISKKCRLSSSLSALQAMAAVRLLLGATLLFLAMFPSLAGLRYVISVPLFIMSAMSLVSLTLVRYLRMTAWQHLTLEFVLSVPSSMFIMSMALRLGAIMLPTAGRMPANYPDYIVGAFNLAFAVLISTTVSGIEFLFSRKRNWLPIGLMSTVCLALMLAPLSPYDEGVATQRHYWFHTEIITYDVNRTLTERSSGVLVTRQDAYTLKTVLPALEASGSRMLSRSDFGEDCKKYVHCNLPLHRPRFARYLSDVLFLHMEPPSPFDPAPSLNVSRSCVGSACIVECVMIGPPHNTLTILPQPGVNLTDWSFSSPVQPTSLFSNRSVYVISHSTATYSEKPAPLEFTLTFNVTHTLQPIVEISHHAHKVAHPEDFTDAYERLLDAAPKYFNIASSLSIRSNYIF